MTELEATDDPRLVDDGCCFEEQEKFSAALKKQSSPIGFEVVVRVDASVTRPLSEVIEIW